ncbi:MAG: hypothetical protein F2947_09700 [Actinobacteria bacterium]|uniref:Unannotated protein n=1 Tax=freshwater metagenome TaxID=449393 RepID=A0A6J7VRZ4_9ZZZZ|nr:hypothetical protein [Actinomycetota bacterium]MSZ52986.1 hypothetical protein [Actinomycetota bacterium]MTA45577.1 hypothetical protein [Actinomycetota bacterium]
MNLLSNRVLALGSTALLGAGGTGALLLAGSAAASANVPLSVTNLSDSGLGSLRQALLDANSAPGQDVITFATGVSGTISLLSDFPLLTEAIDLEGPGRSVITIDGGWTQAGGPLSGHDVFDIDDGVSGAGTWTLSGFTVTGGNDSGEGWSGGGAIAARNSAPLNISDVALTANYSDRVGGAILLSGTGNVVITHSSITGNSTAGGGGGLYADTENYSTLTIINSDISNNTAGKFGGGLYLDTDGGNITIVGSTISNNSALQGGGAITVTDLYVEGSLTITDTVISGNHAGENGGALYSDTDDGSIFITDSTISNNTAGGAGGGLYISSTGLGEIVIANSTISGNESTTGAGAMQLLSGSKMTLLQSTVTNNTGGGATVIGGVSIEADDLTLIGSIVAGNSGFDIGDGGAVAPLSVTSQRTKDKGTKTPRNRPALTPSVSPALVLASAAAEYSVIGEVDPAVTIVDGGGNKLDVADPKLGPLADNGGPTMTHALLAGSPAINTGPNPVPTFTGNQFDQRGTGFARIAFGVADAGAFELQEPAGVPIAPSFTG